MQGRERSALPGLNWEGRGGVIPSGPVTRDALYPGIRHGPDDTLTAVRPGAPADRSEGKNLEKVILQREVTNVWWLSVRRDPEN